MLTQGGAKLIEQKKIACSVDRTQDLLVFTELSWYIEVHLVVNLNL